MQEIFDYSSLNLQPPKNSCETIRNQSVVTLVCDLDETCDGDEDVSNAYHAKSWPDGFPTGYLYKGKKKALVNAVDTLKTFMKKGNKRTSDPK